MPQFSLMPISLVPPISTPPTRFSVYSVLVTASDPAVIIEQHYQDAIDRLTPREKIARGLAMFDWARSWISRQVIAERGPMPDDRLRWEVALRPYGSDPVVRTLIERHLAGIA